MFCSVGWRLALGSGQSVGRVGRWALGVRLAFDAFGWYLCHCPPNGIGRPVSN